MKAGLIAAPELGDFIICFKASGNLNHLYAISVKYGYNFGENHTGHPFALIIGSYTNE